MASLDSWTETEMIIEIQDPETGELNPVKVPAKENPKTSVRVFSLEHAAREEKKYLAQRYNLDLEHLSELLMLYSPAKNIRQGEIKTKYSFNKMLFYVWKCMEEFGYGNIFPMPEFNAARAGPVPVTLNQDIEKLRDMKLVNYSLIKNGKKVNMKGRRLSDFRSPDMSKSCELTKEGKKIAEKLWKKLTPSMQQIFIDVKQRLFLMSPTELKEKVHREFPDYQIKYTDLDEEKF